MAERVYKLYFKTPLFVGTWGIGREETLSYIPADTLFSALVIAWAALGQTDIMGSLPGYAAQPANFPFRITSAFPLAGSVRFFPRPQRYLDNPSETIEPKRLKQADWVSETIFNRLRLGELPGEHLDKTVNFVQGKKVWLTRPEREQLGSELNLADAPEDPCLSLRLWHQDILPRVAIDRLSNASNLFHSGRVIFAAGCGLWFAARGDHLAWIDTALNYLADVGLGGLRGTGHGAFEPQAEADSSPLPSPGNEPYFINLARFAPTPSEIGLALRADQAAYKLVTVGGWCQDDATHPWRRRRVRLVAEGAYLGWQANLTGQLVDVTPDKVGHFNRDRKVYRYGLAFPVSTQ